MWSSRGKYLASLASTLAVLVTWSAVQHASVTDVPPHMVLGLVAVSADANHLRWDLAKRFKFDWKSVDLSAKLRKGDNPNAPVRTLSISVTLDILDMTKLVVVDVNSVGIREVLDQDSKAMQYQAIQSDQTRRYDARYWNWDQGETWLSGQLPPANVKLQLSCDPKSPPSSISQLTGFIYGLYAGDIIKVDIPFDPNYGWHEATAMPDLLLCVDLLTPPCPGPLQYVDLLPTSADSRRYNLHRPKTPIPLYKYQTWVKSKKGGPMMGLFDPVMWYPRSFFPLGDYAIVRTELFDSKKGKAGDFLPTPQWIVGDPSGNTGARCSGQKEQDSADTYDSIRHVIAVHPIEVKIPFVLKNIPIP